MAISTEMRHALFVLLLLAPSVSHAQLLGRASDAARGSSSSDDDDDDYDYDDDQGGSFLSGASRTARGGWDDDDDRGSRRSGGTLGRASRVARGGGGGGGSGGSSERSVFVLQGCPYEDDRPGLGYSAPAWDAPVGMAGRLELEGGYALGGAGRGAFGARFQFPGAAIDVTMRYSLFIEPVDSGFLALALGRVGLEYRVLQMPEVQIRIGGGVRHMEDQFGGLFGGDALVGVDLFFGDPAILSLEAGIGMVGEAAIVMVRGSLGIIVDSTEIYAGYHYEGLFAAGQHVDLGGPMAGLRYWL